MSLTITCASTAKGLEQEVDSAISEFDAYFRNIQSDGIGLSNPERCIIKTFCAYFLGLGPNNPHATSKKGTPDA
jgi:hypothetical protein